MASSEAGTLRIPEHMIEAITEVMRTSRQMLPEIGRAPTPEGLAKKLAMPLEKLRKVLEIAKHRISLKASIEE